MKQKKTKQASRQPITSRKQKKLERKEERETERERERDIERDIYIYIWKEGPRRGSEKDKQRRRKGDTEK